MKQAGHPGAKPWVAPHLLFSPILEGAINLLAYRLQG